MIDSLRSGGIFDFEKKEVRLQEILEALNDPSVWEDLEKSKLSAEYIVDQLFFEGQEAIKIHFSFK